MFWGKHQALLSSVVLLIATAGCGSASPPEQPVFGPIALTRNPTAPASELRFVYKAPREAQPASGRVVRAEGAEIGDHWIAPWISPEGNRDFFCHYWRLRGYPGPLTNCFDGQSFSKGTSYSISTDRRLTFVTGFLPERWQVAVVQKGTHVPLHVRNGVYFKAWRRGSLRLAISSPQGRTRTISLPAMAKPRQ